MAQLALLVSLAHFIPATLSTPIQTSPLTIQDAGSEIATTVLNNQDPSIYSSWIQHRLCKQDSNSGAPANAWVGKLCGWGRHGYPAQSADVDVVQVEQEEATPNVKVEIEVSVTIELEEEEEEEEPLPENCEIIEDLLDENGNPSVICDYIDGDYDEWLESLNKPFLSRKGCLLTAECHQSHHFEAHPKCACYCDDEQVPLLDDRCDGFTGKIPEYFIPITIPK